jgi:hypothetical protein
LGKDRTYPRDEEQFFNQFILSDTDGSGGEGFSAATSGKSSRQNLAESNPQPHNNTPTTMKLPYSVACFFAAGIARFRQQRLRRKITASHPLNTILPNAPSG